MALADWEQIGEKLTENELLFILNDDEGEYEAWRLVAALGFLCLKRNEIGLNQIEALTSAGMDLISLSMFDAAFDKADGDDLADMLPE
jgi:hypothetical protein